jgi:hypothetical protein
MEQSGRNQWQPVANRISSRNSCCIAQKDTAARWAFVSPSAGPIIVSATGTADESAKARRTR